MIRTTLPSRRYFNSRRHEGLKHSEIIVAPLLEQLVNNIALMRAPRNLLLVWRETDNPSGLLNAVGHLRNQTDLKGNTGPVVRSEQPGSPPRQNSGKAGLEHQVHVGTAYTRARDMRLPISLVFAIADECRAVVPWIIGNLPCETRLVSLFLNQ